MDNTAKGRLAWGQSREWCSWKSWKIIHLQAGNSKEKIWAGVAYLTPSLTPLCQSPQPWNIKCLDKSATCWVLHASAREKYKLLSSPGQSLKMGVRPGLCHSPTQLGATTYQKAKEHSSKEAPNEAFPGLLRRQLWTENKFLAKGILISQALGQWILVINLSLLITSPSKIPPWLVSLFPAWFPSVSFLLHWSFKSFNYIIKQYTN